MKNGNNSMDYTALDEYQRKTWDRRFEYYQQKDHSPEREAILAPFNRELERLAELIRPYENTYEMCFYEQQKHVVRWEYARGGEVLERGFYHPCPVIDLVTAGAKRGRLIQYFRKNNPPTYTFGFDQNDRLITVVKRPKDSKVITRTVINYLGNRTLALYFSGEGSNAWMGYAEECVYHDECLSEYTAALFMRNADSIYRIHKKEYSYLNGKLHEMSDLSFMPNANLISRRVYCFSHDADGYLNAYWLTWSEGAPVPEKPYKYTISVKRKV